MEIEESLTRPPIYIRRPCLISKILVCLKFLRERQEFATRYGDGVQPQCLTGKPDLFSRGPKEIVFARLRVILIFQVYLFR